MQTRKICLRKFIQVRRKENYFTQRAQKAAIICLKYYYGNVHVYVDSLYICYQM